MSYLLECYDALFRQINSLNPVNYKNGLDFLLKNESDSYRIYTINVFNEKDNNSIEVSKPIHSYQPKVKKLELKSIFNFNEFENIIPLLKKHINFTGETILFAVDPAKQNRFYVYEKCEITALNNKEIFFLYCNKYLKQENQNIKLAINEKVFKLKSAQKIEHYIHKHQLAIESLLNRLIKSINLENNKELYQFSDDYTRKDNLKTIYINLEKLLVFIDKEYSNYLNENIMVPHRKVLMNEYTIKPKLDFVRDSLMGMDVNQQLLKVIFEPLIILSTINIQNKITYNQFNYALEYISCLSEVLNESEMPLSEEKLCSCIIELNVNSFRFFDYKTNLIQAELNNCESDHERLNLLFRKLKKFNQHQIKVKKQFNDKLPELKEQICNWIEEEIEFINRKRNLEELTAAPFKMDENKVKILSGLSVAQMSYFINILMQAGIIKHTNQRDVLRMISENFKTNVTDSISLDSLSTKYYNVESSTKAAIKDKVIELLNLTKG